MYVNYIDKVSRVEMKVLIKQKKFFTLYHT